MKYNLILKMNNGHHFHHEVTEAMLMPYSNKIDNYIKTQMSGYTWVLDDKITINPMAVSVIDKTRAK